ncbi:AAA family ATPase [Mesoplasma lactucae]|uniref:Uncharacterized protein n=1 Tax=Mesoplasma lactucae ATCC 49193 TaxID=81460 RepID=A0A291IRV4_9MOLU|nr:AAA family ATPase [Mesoplasma lactucae]ATG97421.1 hypothetical protein CP520_01440 [Mesoplasma lactucae ATCC 49193]ATZ20126.1 exodeoxyribonuclease V subunit alpha [Mesoplasma lactucae ATCC 49193]MCL8216874.1 ATP-dependent RecD-like DNA helicase [Mesoplasma lactucae ATCC 49193]
MTEQNREKPELISITGTITKFLFQNQSGWGVALFKSDKQENASLKIKGQIGQLQPHVNYELLGEFEDNTKYGKSFNVLESKLSVGETKQQAVSYLSSSLFPGIGKQAAQVIADYYETEIVDKIMINPDSLYDIPELAKPKADIIKHVLKEVVNENKYTKTFYENKLKIDFYNYLKEHTDSEVELTDILEKDFYRYAKDHHLEPFEEVEKVAMYFQKLQPDDPIRIAWTANKVVNDILWTTGDTYTNIAKVTKNLQTYLKIFDAKTLEKGLLKAKELKILYFVNHRIYSDVSWNDENEIAKFVHQKTVAEDKNVYDQNLIETLIEKVEEELAFELEIQNFKYDNEQRDALRKSINSNFMLLTGGPGTGKSTVIKGIYKLAKYVNNWDKQNIKVAAPTGRAAARLNEIDQELNATTIHKMLGAEENGFFRFNNSNPLEYNLLILDESSMIENFLFARVVDAAKDIQKIILVGDRNQLSSVGYGELFANLLDVEQITKVNLKQPHRQENGNDIVDLAYKVLNREITSEEDLKNMNNVNVVFDGNVEDKLESIDKIFSKEVEPEVENSLLDLQIIAPFYKGILGINSLNKMLQQTYQKEILKKDDKTLNEQTFERREYKYIVDDKIMYLVNETETGLNNGDVGIISEISQHNGKINQAKVLFNGETKTFYADNFNYSTLSYACSVHKTQGSEYKNVILVLEKGVNEHFINNKIIYTAITRAKKNLTIVGDFNTFYKGINRSGIPRKTTLVEKIEDLFN